MLNLEQSILTYCAPTLAGVKASSMFSIRHTSQSRHVLLREIMLWKMRLFTKGVILKIINYQKSNSAFLIMIYRKKELEISLYEDEKIAYLHEYGYPISENIDAMLLFLIKRVQNSETFPHEIGFFLDYPTRDVIGFIENCGNNYTCNGLWKSYSNPTEAKARFNLIRQCTEEYCEEFNRGKSVMQLIQVI